MPCGISSGPLTFTKVMRPVLEYMRSKLKISSTIHVPKAHNQAADSPSWLAKSGDYYLPVEKAGTIMKKPDTITTIDVFAARANRLVRRY
ncbi:MAG: hypothetical protein EZS28_036257 [Streblomastix strix]|uniref:Reverse transcriptase domain-containing protein n=1 Tax=Streblomastix strix TaxID=222440 RepID=A0A5J4UBL6_9EUKA|nr:MAG: hypothetical protein EZS28_036257 [Streblomastix strix]